MKLNLVKIGNSFGVRLPKTLIKQCHFKLTLVVKVVDGGLLLLPGDDEGPRAGWDEAFKKMAQAGDDQLLDSTMSDLPNKGEDWQW